MPLTRLKNRLSAMLRPKGISIPEYVSFLNRIRRRSPAGGVLAAGRPASPRKPHRLGVLAIFKNESHLIEEWLDHYLAVGVDRIFLIDNGSTDDTVAKLTPWLRDGRVELITCPEQHQQQRHYWNAFCHFRIQDRCEWLMIADIDEFWFCKSDGWLDRYLDSQPDVEAMYVNWSMFGSSGLQAQPVSVRRSLVRKDPNLARQTKCIFRTFLPVREDDIEVHNVKNAVPWRVRLANHELQLNHYATQSRDFWFNVKMTRGDVFFTAQDMSEMAARFDRINDAATVNCTRLRDLVQTGFKP